MYFAHSGTKPDYSDWQLLKDHLCQVAHLAKRNAQATGCELLSLTEMAYATGLLHDLGKYRPEFQQMIRGLCPKNHRTYHKQAGAAKAFAQQNAVVAFAIAGHHGGMPDAGALLGLVRGESGMDVANQIWPIAVQDCNELATLELGGQAAERFELELAARILFSCLVDADWRDTNTFYRRMAQLPTEPQLPALNAATWLEQVLRFIGERAEKCQKESPTVAAIRNEILEACLAAAKCSPGLFSLTVPTGGGKTLSALAFALQHASMHLDNLGQPLLRRIIYVAPYLSIIDQNVQVIQQALGFDASAPEVFAHHSLAEPPGDEDDNETEREAAARRAENWDAPIIITTNVQFFESLFSNKPGRCRKLHNITRSVVILDECQTLPPALVAPTCAMINQLVAHLGCTVVLCTATQPAFDHSDMPERLIGVREIIPTKLELFRRLRRVHVSWPEREEYLDWSTVAEKMVAAPSALCIVNTRAAARELFHVLQPRRPGDVFHLSTGMCPAHRLAVLDGVKLRLEKGLPCYLVSTQLIEAGVDIDFPFVLRELGPLEAIIQSAGRCNREGRWFLDDGSPGGRVQIFRSQRGSLPADKWYRAGKETLETAFLNNDRQPSIDNPEDIREYFERLYRTGELDAKGIQKLRHAMNFQSVADEYRLIKEDGIAVVVATWQSKAMEVEELLKQIKTKPTRRGHRKLAPFQVNLRRYEVTTAAGAVMEEAGIFVWRGFYDNELGLSIEETDSLLLV